LIAPVDHSWSVPEDSNEKGETLAIGDQGSHSAKVGGPGRSMAPILFHSLSQLSLPVVCVESQQAYKGSSRLRPTRPDRNDAGGLAHLARTGFFKPVHVKSLSAHAVRPPIIARKKLVYSACDRRDQRAQRLR
jgi:hypothetical protein